MLPTSTISRLWNLSPSTLEGLRREFDSAVSAAAHGCDTRSGLAVWEADDRVTIELDVPGVSEDNLEVSVEDGVLNISGERHKPERDGELKHQEGRFGSFERSIRLHETLDPTTITAELDHGILSLTILRRAESQPRKIPIGVRTAPTEGAES